MNNSGIKENHQQRRCRNHYNFQYLWEQFSMNSFLHSEFESQTGANSVNIKINHPHKYYQDIDLSVNFEQSLNLRNYQRNEPGKHC